MAKSEVGFTGEVGPAMCQCHAGQYVVLVFLINPFTQGREPCGFKVFKTEAEAQEKMESVVMHFAEIKLAEAGLKIEEAISVEAVRGDAAIERENRLYRNQNPNLH